LNACSFSKPWFCSESRSSVGVWASGCENPTKNKKWGNLNSGMIEIYILESIQSLFEYARFSNCSLNFQKWNYIHITCMLLHLLMMKTFQTFITKVVERRKQIETKEQEIKWKEKELIATVKLPAEAEAYKV
jgi:hypothetical protein